MRIAAAIIALAGMAWAAAAGDPGATEPRQGSRDGAGATLFADDFENGLNGWTIVGRKYVDTRLTNDSKRGRAMALTPGGDVLALIRGSEKWAGPVRIEGDVMFPTDEDNYLGVAYNHRHRGRRHDFGLIYIKGNDNYLQVNFHRDFNVSRTLYPEGRVALTGSARITAGVWQRFAVEVSGTAAHFYVGNVDTPQLTFSAFEFSEGALGLQPRSVGGDVWVDNVRVTRIRQLSRPASGEVPSTPSSKSPPLTDWRVIGPLRHTDDRVAESPTDNAERWRSFAPDRRGAVVTGRVVDYHGENTVAYFRSVVATVTAHPATLHFSTVDDLAVWVNGRFHWFVPRSDAAWFDFLTNPAHRGQRIPIELRAGENQIVVRVRGGVYASGGFFAAVEGSQQQR